jgi:hypothetical protein
MDARTKLRPRETAAQGSCGPGLLGSGAAVVRDEHGFAKQVLLDY